MSTAGYRAKRVADVLGACALIVATAPVLAVAAVMIKLYDGGPVFYRQTRIGLHGERFTLTKLRTMRVGAEHELIGLLTLRGLGSEPGFKVLDDPRVTRLGRFLRRYSIDELPQLVSVVTGRMSLVGPRPMVPAEVDLFDPAAHGRHRAKPGITGLWQVSGRNSLAWDEAIALDLHYVSNCTPAMDTRILARTVRAVLLPPRVDH